MSDELYVGDLWRIKATITDPDTLLPVDPNTVLVTVQDPLGAITHPPVTKDGTGEDKATVELTSHGTWHATVTTTGSYQGVETTQISVRKAPTP